MTPAQRGGQGAEARPGAPAIVRNLTSPGASAQAATRCRSLSTSASGPSSVGAVRSTTSALPRPTWATLISKRGLRPQGVKLPGIPSAVIRVPCPTASTSSRKGSAAYASARQDARCGAVALASSTAAGDRARRSGAAAQAPRSSGGRRATALPGAGQRVNGRAADPPACARGRMLLQPMRAWRRWRREC